MFAQNNNTTDCLKCNELSDRFTTQARIHTQPKSGGGWFERDATDHETS